MTTEINTYNDMTTTQLLERYNELAEAYERPVLASWKRSKVLLIKRIETLDVLNEVEETTEEATPTVLEDEDGLEEDGDIEGTEDNTEETEKTEGLFLGLVAPGATIRETSLNLLCQAHYYEDKAKKAGPDNVVEKGTPGSRSVGLPYSTVLAVIHAKYPKSKTSMACLRWYAVKVRAEETGYEGYRLAQRRPRPKPESK